MIERHSLQETEISALRARFAEDWPEDAAVIEAITWISEQGPRGVKVWISTQAPPTWRVWLLVGAPGAEVVTTRPANREELDQVVGILREVGATEAEITAPVARADVDVDTPERTLKVSFTRLDDMVEGTVYKEWFVRFHVEGGPPSIAYGLVTRRGQWFKTLPGGRIVRGAPW